MSSLLAGSEHRVSTVELFFDLVFVFAFTQVTTLWLEQVTLENGERLPFSFLFFFLGAQPCTEWLDDAVARAADGFILTGDAAGADNLLETSVPGIFAAGDVRSGSTKRCAAAVGEGSMAVQFVHEHLAAPKARVG